jgi:hypothetical protein
MGHLRGPLDAETVAKGGGGKLAEFIARELQGALASNSRLGIVRERGKAVHLLKNT